MPSKFTVKRGQYVVGYHMDAGHGTYGFGQTNITVNEANPFEQFMSDVKGYISKESEVTEDNIVILAVSRVAY